jgi:hypothetical protein
MAELTFRVKAEYQSAIECREELKKVEQQLKQVNEKTSQSEIDKLVKRHAELVSKWENSISLLGKAGVFLKNAFSGIGKSIKEGADSTKSLGTTTKEIIDNVQKRLETEERLLNTQKLQRAEAQKTLAYAEEGLKRNQDNLIELRKRLDEAYNGQARGFYSDKDKADLESAEATVQKWIDLWADANSQILDYDKQIANTTTRIEGLGRSMDEAFGTVSLDDLRGNIDQTSQKIFELENRITSLKQSIADKQNTEKASEQLVTISEAINKVKEKINEFLPSISDFSLEGINKEQERLSNTAESLKQSIQSEADSIEYYQQQQEKVKTGTEEWNRLQSEIDFHTSEKEKYTSWLEETTQLQDRLADSTKELNKLYDQFDRTESIATNSVENQSDIAATKKELADTNEELKEQQDLLQKQKEAFGERTAEYAKMVGAQKEEVEQVEENTQKHFAMRTQIMQAREEMIQMIAAGKQGTPEFMALAQRAGEMREQLGRANAYMQYFDNPQRGLTTLKTGLQGVAGAASLVTSTIGLFNEDSKKMMEIQTKVQSILGIIVGLETTYNLVKKDSILIMAIEEVKTWALAKARGVQAAATTAATGAQEALNTTMLKNPYGAIIALLVTLGAAIWAVTKALTSETDAEKKAREEKEAHIKAIQEQQEKWATSVAESASKQITAYKKLQEKWSELGSNMTKKKKFIKDNQSAFHSLGFAVNSVTDAENIFVKNTDAVVNSIMARAKAAAYEELAMDEIKKQYKQDIANNSIKGGKYRTTFKVGQKLTADQISMYKKRYGLHLNIGDAEGVLNENDAKVLNEASEKYAIKQRNRVKKEKEEHQKRLKDIQKRTKEELEAEKKAAEAAGIKLYDSMTDKKDKDKKNTGKTAAEKAQELRELMDKQKRDEIRAAEDLEFSTREARIKAMAESTEKTIAQIKLNHDKEVKAIERAYEDIRIKRVEAAKAVWEKDEKNKGKNFFDSSEYRKALVETSRKRMSDTEVDDIRQQEMDIINSLGKDGLIEKLKEEYGKGNVDVIARPIIDAARLTAAGWKDAGDGIATVFSMQRTLLDAQGNERQVLFTPILPDGTVMSPSEIDSYLSNVLDGAQDFLDADKNKIIIKVGGIGENKDLGGNDLHLGQEELYKGVENKIMALYDNATDAEKENKNLRLMASMQQMQKAIEDENKKQMQIMLDYLKVYGTMAEQRSAIETEFDQKIAAARAEGNVWGAAALEQQKKQALDKQDLENIKSQIDWEGIFNNLDRYSGSFLESIRTQLQAILNDPNITPENAKVVSDALDKLDGAIIEKTGNTFHWINSYLLEQKRLQEEARRAAEAYTKALGEQLNASIELTGAQNSINRIASRLSGGSVDLSNENITSANRADIFKRLGIKEGTKEAEELNAAFDKLANTEKKVSKASSEVEKAEKKKESTEEKARQKTSEKVAGWLKGINDNVQKYLGDLPNLLGTLGFGEASEKIQKGLNGINDAAGAAADFASGNYVGAAMKGISAINNFGEALGAWSNSNRAEVEAENNKLSVAMSVNTEAVNRLTDAMKKATPAEAFKYYEQAVSALELNEQSARQKMLNNVYMYDGGHSLNYDLDDANGTIQAIFRLLKMKPNGDYDLGGLLRTLSAKDWNELYKSEEGRKLLQKLGQAIAGAEDDGNYNGMFQDILDFINSYNEDAYQELANQFNEAVTNISFDSMYNSFVSSLMDMDKKAQDFTQDFEGYMRNAIYQSLAAEQIKPLLEEWYGAFADFMKDGNLSVDEINALKSGGGTYKDQNGETKEFKSLNNIEETALQMRNGIEQLGLYNGKNGYNQTATGKSMENISYTQADSLVGIATAQQITQEQSRDRLDMLNAKADQMYITNIEVRDIAADSRDILAGMAIHVEEIRDGVVDTLVPVIKDMRSDLEKVRKLVEEQ